jgi:hypothetical protein
LILLAPEPLDKHAPRVVNTEAAQKQNRRKALAYSREFQEATPDDPARGI